MSTTPETAAAKEGAHRQRRPIGYVVTSYYCRKCAPDGVREFHEPEMKSDEDALIPYVCDVCGEEFKPCDRQWDDWTAAYQGPGSNGAAEIRFCTQPDCGSADYR